MKKIMLITLSAATLLLTSCATILSGTSDQITFSSDPSGAKILVDGLEVGKTPAQVSIKRPGFSDKYVTLKLKGYDDRNFMLSKSFNGMAICNLNNPLGWLIDLLTGTIFKYDRKNYNFDLDPKAYNINELKVDKNGNYIVPDYLNRQVMVYDEELGIEILFQ